MRNNKLSLSTLTILLFLSICSQNSFSTQAPISNPTPAPNRGIIPRVSDHYKTSPSFYNFNQLPIEQITPMIGRRFIIGTQISVIQWILKKGTVLSLHHHLNEQVTRVDKGELEVYSQGQKYVMEPGDIMIFPPNVPHEFIALKDTVIYEQHTPVRQDFLDPDFGKKLIAANIANK